MPLIAMPMVLVFMAFVSTMVAVATLIRGYLFVPGVAVIGINAGVLTYLATLIFGRDNLVSPCIPSLSAIALIWGSIHCIRGVHRQSVLGLLWGFTWAMLCTALGGAYWIDYFHRGQLLKTIAEVVTVGSWYIAQALLVVTIIAALVAAAKMPPQQPQNNKRRES